MSVRQDKVQIVLEFINEESKSLARHTIEAKKLNDEVKKLVQEDAKLTKEFEKANAAGKSTLEIEQKRLNIQNQIKDKLSDIIKAGKGLEGIDLNKVAPTQLLSVAKELERMVGANGFIPKGTEQFTTMSAALKKVNDQLAINRAATKGVAINMHEANTEGGRFGRIMEVALGTSFSDLAQNFLGKLKDIGVSLYNRAKEIEFVGNKTKLVFGEASKDIERFAETMKERVGQSKNEVLKDLTQISNFFTTLEFDKKFIPGLTKQVYDLSAAWAEYNAGQYSIVEVTEKLQTALGGELDELAEIGIAITEDALKKELQLKGYDKLTGAAYDQAAALTLIEIVTRKTQEAQANFGSHSETMAAKQNRITSMLREQWDDLGIRLKGVFSTLLGFGAMVLDKVLPAQKSLTASAQDLQEAFNRDIDVIQTANVTTAERAKLIRQLNSEYKEYLPSLVSEKATNEELNAVREKGNELFKQQIFYLAYKQKLTELEAKTSGALKTIFDSEIEKARIAHQQSLETNNDIADAASGMMVSVNDHLEQRKNVVQKTIDTQKGVIKSANDEMGELKAISQKVAKDLGVSLDELSTKWDKKKTSSPAITFNPEKTKEEIDKQMKLELDAAKAITERKLVILETEKLEGKKTAEEYNNELYSIRVEGLQREKSIFDKYKQSESLDAAKVAKEIIEAEKNKSEAILKIRLEEAEKFATVKKAIAEQKFLQDTEGDTSPEKFEQAKRAYKLRLIDIDRQTAIDRMLILREFHKAQGVEFLQQQNIILKLAKDKANLLQKTEEESQKETLKKLHEEIENRVIAVHEGAAREDAALRVKFAGLVFQEQALELARLELKREAIKREIAIRQQGDDAQREQAKKLGDDLIKVEGDIDAKKLENKRRTKELEEALDQQRRKTAVDALDVAIDLLGKDEAARKKHATAIKAFEVAKVVVNSISEISEIWKHNTKTFGPIIGGVLSAIQTAVSAGRAVVAIRNINNQKFAKGGFTGDMPGEADETGEVPAGIVHTKEWVGNRPFVAKNLPFFQRLNRLQLANADIASLNLLPRQNLYIPQYSVVNNTNSYTPQGGYANDNSEKMIAAFLAFKSEISQWQKELIVDFQYQKFKKFQNRLEADFSNTSL